MAAAEARATSAVERAEARAAKGASASEKAKGRARSAAEEVARLRAQLEGAREKLRSLEETATSSEALQERLRAAAAKSARLSADAKRRAESGDRDGRAAAAAAAAEEAAAAAAAERDRLKALLKDCRATVVRRDTALVEAQAHIKQLEEALPEAAEAAKSRKAAAASQAALCRDLRVQVAAATSEADALRQEQVDSEAKHAARVDALRRQIAGCEASLAAAQAGSSCVLEVGRALVQSLGTTGQRLLSLAAAAWRASDVCAGGMGALPFGQVQAPPSPAVISAAALLGMPAGDALAVRPAPCVCLGVTTLLLAWRLAGGKAQPHD